MDDCIEWQGFRMPKGYGQVSRDGDRWLAHRLAWTDANGPIPAGLNVLHRCDNPPCINPAHLFLGTQADNVADMVAKGRANGGMRPQFRTHCPHGHEFDETNTFVDARGWKYCRTCRRDHERRRRARLVEIHG